ncbi:phage tail sheath protein [Rappaport israeli]|uniref:phage tail sheath protein n=1 Tax=Rappaport israeli TaxID=1839807 RepID=UPI000931E1A8|nr:phage tail sheath protein [Rappaport israeli]
MPDYLHGVRVIEQTDGARPIRTIATSIIGLIATADDADASLYPLNEPVLLTDLATAIGKAGQSGTLAKALNAIYRQANAMTVVVRVSEDTDTDAQDANVIGAYTDGKYTGLKALLTAQSKLRVTPRILGAPGLDSQAVTTEMVSIAKKLRAFAYAHAVGDSKESAATYEQNFADRELMLIYGDWQGWDETQSAVSNIDSVATALGLRAKLDNDIGWHKTLSNVAVSGVMGIDRDITFNISDPSNDANYLNSKNVTALVHSDGYRYWGNRSASDDPAFAFESYVRTAQVIADTMEEAHNWAIDKPLSPGLASDIIAGVNAKLRELTARGYLLGGQAWFDSSLNPKETLRDGKLTISYDYTPVPPLEQLEFIQKITDVYLVDFARRIEAGTHF